MNALLERVQTTLTIKVDMDSDALGGHEAKSRNLSGCLSLGNVPEGQISLTFTRQYFCGGQALTKKSEGGFSEV
ncbi:hypothetical protein DESA109040_13445 [Deinococcus saxicola]